MPLRVIPLGGLGEFGLNSLLFDDGESAVLVDAGLMFPDDTMLGIDFVIPDFRCLREVSPRLRALLLTHGHEDHIGAVSFLLKEFDVPVYGTPLTLGLFGTASRSTAWTGSRGSRRSSGPAGSASGTSTWRRSPSATASREGSATSCGAGTASLSTRGTSSSTPGRWTASPPPRTASRKWPRARW